MLRDSILSSHGRKFVGSARRSLESFGKGKPEARLSFKKKKIIINLFFLLIKMKCKLCSGLLEQLAASSHYEARASAMEA